MCDSIANGVRRGVLASDVIQPFANLVVSNSVTATNVFATTYYGDGGQLSNVQLAQPLANLVVSNSVTTTNVNVNGTLQVAGAMTSNTANTTFYYDTFTIPYINTQLLNVSALTTLNVLQISNLNSLVSGTLNVSSISNLNSVTTLKANVGTLNVSSISNLNSLVSGTLNVSSISNLNSLVTPTANVGTLNVATISNLNSLTLTNNLTTTNLFATGNTSTISNMVIQNFDFIVATTAGSYTNVCSIVDVPNGSAIYAIYVDMMARGAGGSAQTKTYIIVSNYNATGGVWTRALPIGNPSAGGQTGLDVMTLNGTTYLRATNRNAAEAVNVGMVIKVSSSSFSRVAITDLTSQTGTGATFTGFYPTTILTQVASRVGISTEQPAANLHVTGNVYVSNTVSIGPGSLGTNVFVCSNVSGGSNVLVMNNLGRVGIATTSPGYPLDVGTVVSIAASGNETIRSKGPVIIGNGTNDGNRFISALDSSIVGGDSRYFVLGKAGSIYNQAELSYTHDADGSTNNRLNLGFFSKIVASLLASGSIGVGTITPSATLHIVGNAYVSNAVQTTNVLASSVSATYPISFRNRIINGDFLIDQRNAYANSTPSGTLNVIDRWKVNIFGSGRCLVGQNLGSIVSPTNFTSYYGMKVTTTTTVGSGDYFFFSQVIEGVNMVDWLWGTSNAKPVTLSFWAYSSLTGTMGGFIRNSGATAGNYTRSYPFTFSISSANTWEYKTIAVSGDVTGQWITGQVDGAEVGIELWNGTAFQSAAGAWAAGNFTGPSGGTANFAGTLNSYLYLTGIQVELGPIATQFERRHLNFELAACQRYYETTIARLGGYHTAGNFLRSSVYFNTKKRPAAAPGFTVVSTLENSNMGSLSLDNSNFDQSSARILSNVITTGDAFGQWKVAIDAEF